MGGQSQGVEIESGKIEGVEMDGVENVGVDVKGEILQRQTQDTLGS